MRKFTKPLTVIHENPVDSIRALMRAIPSDGTTEEQNDHFIIVAYHLDWVTHALHKSGKPDFERADAALSAAFRRADKAFGDPMNWPLLGKCLLSFRDRLCVEGRDADAHKVWETYERYQAWMSAQPFWQDMDRRFPCGGKAVRA